MTALALAFLKLGFLGFGGPAAHIALMQTEFVERRRWLSTEEFVDLLGATNLIPGPNSTEMALHIGYRRGGLVGMLVAGFAFILPAVGIVWILAMLYAVAGQRPQIAAPLRGVEPVVVAILVHALLRMAPRRPKFQLPTVLGAGLVTLLSVPISIASMIGLGGPLTVSPSLGHIFGFFLKAGGLLFGSGYVLFGFLRNDLVARTGWLTEGQLLDAIAIGQLTPGPLFTSATFIGYLLLGHVGALTATVAIFLPAFVFVALSAPILPRLRESARLSALLDGVNLASLALLALVAIQLGYARLRDPLAIGSALVAFALLYHTRISPTWMIVAGLAIGWFYR